ncbi:hypothetical protein ACMU_09535 [Actibacterium mucosum KCTC 23349]|uniref:Uncharacterized protein n=1 Tax=Actibacterium mucosum KCTC 23349 TaxID=1454373 RepID=A0A037ZMG9_9RHOB|nr:DUF1178 family protein [Actibacterium mucosum]KAJ55996.1 hypothetical protein ACMU_09535 [Actibacterium mucosum KCTC 23349]
MIRYALTCKNGHSFDSWFQSADAFDTLLARGLVNCAHCGETDVRKSLMAPNVALSEAKPPAPASTPEPAEAPGPEAALAELKRKIEENSDYVGDKFATEARAMHDGTAPERAIYGEANLADAKALIDDGVPVAPLPFVPTRKTN